MRHIRAASLILIAIALIAAACGGGSDDSTADDNQTDVAGQTADPSPNVNFAPGSYQAQLQSIVDTADADIIAASETFKTTTATAFADTDVDTEAAATDQSLAALNHAYDVLLVEAAKLVPIVIPIMEQAITEIEALDIPEQFADDHAHFLEAMHEQLDVQRNLGIAAANGDIERFFTLGPLTDEIESDLFNNLSPEFRPIVAAFLDDAG